MEDQNAESNKEDQLTMMRTRTSMMTRLRKNTTTTKTAAPRSPPTKRSWRIIGTLAGIHKHETLSQPYTQGPALYTTAGRDHAGRSHKDWVLRTSSCLLPGFLACLSTRPPCPKYSSCPAPPGWTCTFPLWTPRAYTLWSSGTGGSPLWSSRTRSSVMI
jgi:hypothetical protein